MNRSYKIKPIHATMRLDRWIKNNIGKYPQSLLEKSIRKGKIKLNKKKTNSSYKLKIGDEIKQTSYQQKLEINKTYYWKVVTFDIQGNSSDSAVNKFHTAP